MRTLLVDSLATYRLTRLVTRDVITENWRDAVIAYAYREQPHPLGIGVVTSWEDVVDDDPKPPKLADLITCRWCVSIYVAAGVIIARRVAPRSWDRIATALALSAATGLIGALDN